MNNVVICKKIMDLVFQILYFVTFTVILLGKGNILLYL